MVKRVNVISILPHAQKWSYNYFCAGITCGNCQEKWARRARRKPGSILVQWTCQEWLCVFNQTRLLFQTSSIKPLWFHAGAAPRSNNSSGLSLVLVGHSNLYLSEGSIGKMVKNMVLEQTAWVQIAILLHPCWVTWGKLLHLSEPLFPHE